MIFLKLYRLFCGYVCFRARGGFCERFINLCGKSGIILWELNVENGGVTACTKAKDFLKIRNCAVRSGMVTKILSKRGLPFFINRYRRRIGLVYGLVLAVCFLGIMSTMIWSIDISGNNKVTDEQIIKILAEAGVKYGTLRKNVDAASARFYAMEKLPDLSYITVNVIGSCVQVKVSEHVEEPNKTSRELPCDVVSTVDGQIVALEVYHGTKLYKEGEAVRAGEVLAGGFVELTDGSVKFKHAEAYALIRTNLDFEVSTARSTPTLEQSGETKKITLHIMGLDIPLYKDKSGTPTLTRSRSLTLGGTTMPLGFTCETYRTYTQKEHKLDDTRLMLSTAENYSIEKIRTLSGAYICTQDTILEQTANGVTVSTQVLGEISAGTAREMLIEQ